MVKIYLGKRTRLVRDCLELLVNFAVNKGGQGRLVGSVAD